MWCSSPVVLLVCGDTSYKQDRLLLLVETLNNEEEDCSTAKGGGREIATAHPGK